MSSNPPKTNVFVYGTLKKGGGWHHLLKHAEFLDTARTVNRYPMIIQGIPYLLDQEMGECIEGELYSVDSKTLQALDALEQHPNWYHRRLKPVLRAGECVNAFIYFLHEQCYDQITERKGNRLVEWDAQTHHSTFPIS